MSRLIALPLILALLGASVAGAAERRPARNPIVRVVTVSTDRLPANNKAAILAGVLERLNQAASFQPDIALVPETFTHAEAEAVPGPTSDRLSQWARGHSVYVLAGIKRSFEGRTYNSAVLIDRSGGIQGYFDKIHPTERELDEGVTPGATDPPVFETDFGRIGVQICFDVNWWDNWKRLKEKGAQVVFFPAAYPAAEQLSAIALANEFFVVSATWSRPSRIYDITGRVLSATGFDQPWAGAVLPLGRRLYETDNHLRKVPLIQQKYGAKVDVRWYHDDDWFTLASLDPGLTVGDLNQEFGLTPLRDYRRRAAKAIDAARNKTLPAAGTGR